MTTETITFNHILGQGRVNQLGGVFINGRPLPQAVRVQIIEMASKGVKPCHISRQLRVSHGAVSKILNRYAETGSISPGQIGGNPRAKISVQSIEKQLMLTYEENPNLCAAELRQILIEQEVCSRSTAPTVASINRFIRGKGWHREKKPEKKRLSHSIDSILGISLDSDGKSSSSDDDCFPTSESKRNRTSFSAEQLETLENAFKANTYPDATERETIARQTGLTEEKIMVSVKDKSEDMVLKPPRSLQEAPPSVPGHLPSYDSIAVPDYATALSNATTVTDVHDDDTSSTVVVSFGSYVIEV